MHVKLATGGDLTTPENPASMFAKGLLPAVDRLEIFNLCTLSYMQLLSEVLSGDLYLVTTQISFYPSLAGCEPSHTSFYSCLLHSKAA